MYDRSCVRQAMWTLVVLLLVVGAATAVCSVLLYHNLGNYANMKSDGSDTVVLLPCFFWLGYMFGASSG